jgi:hypothetical protein
VTENNCGTRNVRVRVCVMQVAGRASLVRAACEIHWQAECRRESRRAICRFESYVLTLSSCGWTKVAAASGRRANRRVRSVAGVRAEPISELVWHTAVRTHERSKTVRLPALGVFFAAANATPVRECGRLL